MRSAAPGDRPVAGGANAAIVLHNVEAHVRNAEALAAVDTPVLAAGAKVGRAAARLADVADRSGGLILDGLYPPEIEVAGRVVERWRQALLRAGRR